MLNPLIQPRPDTSGFTNYLEANALKNSRKLVKLVAKFNQCGIDLPVNFLYQNALFKINSLKDNTLENIFSFFQ